MYELALFFLLAFTVPCPQKNEVTKRFHRRTLNRKNGFERKSTTYLSLDDLVDHAAVYADIDNALCSIINHERS